MLFRKRKKAKQPNWHPDFRDIDNLPDIKVIRTDFLFNLVGISLAVILFGIVVYLEYRMYSLVDQIESIDANLAKSATADRTNVKLSDEFVKLSGQLEEIAQFQNVPLKVDELMYELAVNQPISVVLEGMSFKPSIEAKGKKTIVKYVLVVNGTVEDTEGEPATKTITNYRKQLSDLECVSDYFEKSELVAFSRDDVLGVYTFTIRVVMADEPVALAASKK